MIKQLANESLLLTAQMKISSLTLKVIQGKEVSLFLCA